MKAYAEFRIPESYAEKFLSGNIGKKSMTKIARKVKVPVGSNLYNEIGRIYGQIKTIDQKHFFLGWNIHRKYSPRELDDAKLLLLKTVKTFEPAGEECGTIYDTQDACDICGAGRRQVSDLVLDYNTIPKTANIAKTISDEVIVDQEFVDILVNNNMTGYKLGTVLYKSHQARSTKHPSNRWYQLMVNSLVNVHPATKTGEDPFDFDEENKYRCKKGHTIGLDILSELSIYERSWDGSDIVATMELLGVNRGLLHTAPLLLVSQRLFQLIKKLKGYTVEVVHLIS